jgi:hypothetical protein
MSDESYPGQSHPADQSQIIRTLVGEVETLRIKRQDDWRDRNHPRGKRFSQEELRRDVCPSYKNLLLGLTQRLPSRAMIMHIADYLECTLAERNDLLLAAQYLPEKPDLEGGALLAALNRAKDILHNLAVPAFVMGRDWTIEASNTYNHIFAGVPAFDSPPDSASTAMHYLFDPMLPMRERVTTTHEAWATRSRNAIRLFQQSNLLYAHDAWYKQRLEMFTKLPDFATCWEQVQQGYTDEHSLADPMLLFHPMVGMLRYVMLSIGSPVGVFYPLVIVCLPADEDTRLAFAKLGFPVQENRWEYALRF